jgi:Ca2+/Na+ antiporter
MTTQAQSLSELRKFYNHTITPELRRMETRRHNMLIFLGASFLVLLAIVLLQIYIKILVVTLVLTIPLALYISYIFKELDEYRNTFKPKVVNLLLDFIDNDVTYNVPLKYFDKGSISPQVFAASRLFNSAAPDFSGEDYISGEMGELDFEMSEVSVKEFSPVRNRLDDVFRGVLLHARFRREVQIEGGEILVLPRHRKPFLSKTIKAFTVKGGHTFEPKNQRFNDEFVVFATATANLRGFLSDDMQRAILRYRERENKDIYMSFIGSDIYIAVTQDKDLLEPELWQSNMSFDLIREYYEDLTLLLSIVLDIDANN